MKYIVKTADHKWRVDAKTNKMAVILVIYKYMPYLGTLISCKGVNESKEDTVYYNSVSVLKDMGFDTKDITNNTTING